MSFNKEFALVPIGNALLSQNFHVLSNYLHDFSILVDRIFGKAAGNRYVPLQISTYMSWSVKIYNKAVLMSIYVSALKQKLRLRYNAEI